MPVLLVIKIECDKDVISERWAFKIFVMLNFVHVVFLQKNVFFKFSRRENSML